MTRARKPKAAGAPERLMNITELADYLGVTVPTIYGWNHTRTGPPPIKMGPNICRWRFSDVEAWLDSRQT